MRPVEPLARLAPERQRRDRIAGGPAADLRVEAADLSPPVRERQRRLDARHLLFDHHLGPAQRRPAARRAIRPASSGGGAGNGVWPADGGPGGGRITPGVASTPVALAGVWSGPGMPIASGGVSAETVGCGWVSSIGSVIGSSSAASGAS